MEKEINEDENFAPVRQIYSGMLLAAWYKRALKDSLLSRIYVNKSRLKGVDQDPRINEIIYQRYLQAYKKGVFNFIKEDVDKYTHLMIPRKYFSGGMIGYNADFAQLVHRYKNIDHTRLSKLEGERAAFDFVQVEEQEVTAHDAAMKIFPKRISAVILRAVLVGFLAGASPVLADENMNEHRFVAPYMLTQNQIDYLKPGINSMAAYLKDVGSHAKRDLPALEEYLIRARHRINSKFTA